RDSSKDHTVTASTSSPTRLATERYTTMRDSTTEPEVGERITQLRTELLGDGLDAGAATIAWHLEREGLPAPSNATIHRILTRAGPTVPERRTRPRSSYVTSTPPAATGATPSTHQADGPRNDRCLATYETYVARHHK